MKAEELRKKGKGDLKKLVQDLRKKLNDIRFKRSSNQLKNVNELGNTRKEIARILTIINEMKEGK